MGRQGPSERRAEVRGLRLWEREGRAPFLQSPATLSPGRIPQVILEAGMEIRWGRVLQAFSSSLGRRTLPGASEASPSTGLKLEIFTLCDSAVDYGGKVCILGAFDSVTALEAPYTVSHCAVVARMRFHRIEEGNHKLRVTLADQDGRMIMPNVDAQVGVRFSEKSQSATFNLVMQINGLKLEQFGEYTVDLAVDGVHQGSLPLYFAQQSSPGGG